PGVLSGAHERRRPRAPGMTIADVLVGQLRAAGVRALFGVPGGGGNLDLIAASGRAGLPFVLTSTETAGAIAALAQAEGTGRIGACLATLGPGPAAGGNRVACALVERAPLVAFTDSCPRSSSISASITRRCSPRS